MFLNSAAIATAGGIARPTAALGRQDVADLQATRATKATGSRAAAATVSPLATNAAMQAFDRGGNAIDAAIAASVMLSVVDGHNSGLGGGCLALIKTADGELLALDGREMAPSRATPEMFYTNGRPDPSKSQIGPLASGVPGLLSTLVQMHDRLGRLPMSHALLGAAEVAEAGFHIPPSYARRLSSAAKHLAKFPSSAAVLLDARGKPWQDGHRLQQSDLAKSLRMIASDGPDWFYQGAFAQQVEKYMQDAGGMLKAADFAAYKTIQRKPIRTGYLDNQVYGFPPPSSGGIHNAQMLGMLSQFDVSAAFEHSEARGRHLLLEVMKRAMADRAYWLGDADFAKVPRSLLDMDYLAQRAKSIRLDAASDVASHGTPPRADVDLFGKGGHTTHLTTADGEGNVVALTQTVNTTFGSKVIVPGTGIVLNNELDDFSIAPGVRNAFGLLGSEANLIAPGKRPLSSMSPTIAKSPGGGVLACGAAGGPKIITTVLQILVRSLALGKSIDEAVAAPRSHHQWSPNEAVCETGMGETVLSELGALGHSIRKIGSAAVASGLHINGGTITVASDPRVESSAQAS
ncbi:MAG TPA: gamma-glutamyltransferase [Planctomycetaceae bacterium]|nr:gamma-glutamyltransferase [Planctomycetaceae bacterium]